LDVIFIPKTNQKNWILLEFRVCTETNLLPAKAQEALDQIKDQKYVTMLKAHDVSSALAIGLAFCGK
jgi:hypothetical protein